MIAYFLLAAFFISLIFYWLIYVNPKRKFGVNDLYSEGLDLLISGKRKQAYYNFKNIVKKDTNNIKAYLKLGQVIREGGNAENALKIHSSIKLRRHLTLVEKIELYKNLTLDYYNLNDIHSAIKQCNAILNLEKNNDWAISNLIKFYREISDWKNAVKLYEQKQSFSGNHNTKKLALFKIQYGRQLLKKSLFNESRQIFKEALEIEKDIPAAYYFIGSSYAQESQNLFQEEKDNKFDDDNPSEKVKDLLNSAIPMWIKYTELKPECSWLVIHLLKDSLFALNRYHEMESILENIIKKDSDNFEVIASLADIYSSKGENEQSLELIENALEQDSSSLLIRLIKVKLKLNESIKNNEVNRDLDELIQFLVKDKRFHMYKNTSTDPDIIWLYDDSGQDSIL